MPTYFTRPSNSVNSPTKRDTVGERAACGVLTQFWFNATQQLSDHGDEFLLQQEILRHGDFLVEDLLDAILRRDAFIDARERCRSTNAHLKDTTVEKLTFECDENLFE